MKAKKYKAFTLVELLTVVMIIALLIGVLVPALSQVKKIAKEVKQKAQLTSIEIGITMYKNDFGEYPPSHGYDPAAVPAFFRPVDYGYCGAQTLAEAMFGQDLMGFHSASIYRANGQDAAANPLYDFTGWTDPQKKANLNMRKGPYLDRTNIGVFDPCQIFGPSASFSILKKNRYVICDVFTAVNKTIGTKTYKIGTPVLYFRANPDVNNMDLKNESVLPRHINNTYNYMDNYYLMNMKKVADKNIDHPLWTITQGEKFYEFIQDPMILNLKKPVRADSFLLISAGFDGLYGTKDDICNFDPNLP